ncbi:hypothetical protein HNP84_001332 [Thermocatellispora tengchongensis]|uniref:Uncharacterized protein n=1 Tax=Thermocatellispora tengchongensis TaxID=1073253 RepID=A0A840NXW0_9ACTN|nr:hypothetical protein [Thermocatellispora tengchongensis]
MHGPPSGAAACTGPHLVPRDARAPISCHGMHGPPSRATACTGPHLVPRHAHAPVPCRGMPCLRCHPLAQGGVGVHAVGGGLGRGHGGLGGLRSPWLGACWASAWLTPVAWPPGCCRVGQGAMVGRCLVGSWPVGVGAGAWRGLEPAACRRRPCWASAWLPPFAWPSASPWRARWWAGVRRRAVADGLRPRRAGLRWEREVCEGAWGGETVQGRNRPVRCLGRPPKPPHTATDKACRSAGQRRAVWDRQSRVDESRQWYPLAAQAVFRRRQVARAGA